MAEGSGVSLRSIFLKSPSKSLEVRIPAGATNFSTKPYFLFSRVLNPKKPVRSSINVRKSLQRGSQIGETGEIGEIGAERRSRPRGRKFFGGLPHVEANLCGKFGGQSTSGRTSRTVERPSGDTFSRFQNGFSSRRQRLKIPEGGPWWSPSMPAVAKYQRFSKKKFSRKSFFSKLQSHSTSRAALKK